MEGETRTIRYIENSMVYPTLSELTVNIFGIRKSLLQIR